MRNLKMLLVITALIFACGCSINKNLDNRISIDYELLLENYEKLADDYEEIAKYEELYYESERKHERLFDEFEAVTDYYEKLCVTYGFLTYVDVYNILPQNYYSDNVRHEDWLCELLDKENQYYCGDFDSLKESCELCCDVEEWRWYFLDVETGIFHDIYPCLDTGTKDFKTPNKIYQTVKYSSAIKSKYIPCSKCVTE